MNPPPPLAIDYEARLVDVFGREYNEADTEVNRGYGALNTTESTF